MQKQSHLSFRWSDEPPPRRVVCGMAVVASRQRRFDSLSLMALGVAAASLALLGWVVWRDPVYQAKALSWNSAAASLQARLEKRLHSPFKAIADALD